jgi:repressor LexA
MKELTERQGNILSFLASYTKKHGYPPTVREIGEHFGFLWAAARGHLQALARKGFIRIHPSRSRGIEITGYNMEHALLVPVAGRIQAGKPVLANELIESGIVIDKSLFPSENAFSLRVTGESMKDAGIFEGDYIIVRPQQDIRNGETGVALIGDEATVKRIFRKNGTVTLKPENRNMKPEKYPSDEVTIIGKVIGVIRKL